MAITTDSYATNWVRVTDHQRLQQLIERFAAQSEVCAGGENWHIDMGLGDSVRISARDLSDGDLSIRDEDGSVIDFESALLTLLDKDEVLVLHGVRWQDGRPHFSCRVHADEKQFEMTNDDIIHHASKQLLFPPTKVVL